MDGDKGAANGASAKDNGGIDYVDLPDMILDEMIVGLSAARKVRTNITTGSRREESKIRVMSPYTSRILPSPRRVRERRRYQSERVEAYLWRIAAYRPFLPEVCGVLQPCLVRANLVSGIRMR